MKPVVSLSEMSREDLERVVIRLQILAQDQRELLDHLAENNSYVQRRVRELDDRRSDVPGWMLRMLGRLPDADLARRRAAENDARVWGRV